MAMSLFYKQANAGTRLYRQHFKTVRIHNIERPKKHYFGVEMLLDSN